MPTITPAQHMVERIKNDFGIIVQFTVVHTQIINSLEPSQRAEFFELLRTLYRKNNDIFRDVRLINKIVLLVAQYKLESLTKILAALHHYPELSKTVFITQFLELMGSFSQHTERAHFMNIVRHNTSQTSLMGWKIHQYPKAELLSSLLALHGQGSHLAMLEKIFKKIAPTNDLNLHMRTFCTQTLLSLHYIADMIDYLEASDLLITYDLDNLLHDNYPDRRLSYSEQGLEIRHKLWTALSHSKLFTQDNIKRLESLKSLIPNRPLETFTPNHPVWTFIPMLLYLSHQNILSYPFFNQILWDVQNNLQKTALCPKFLKPSFVQKTLFKSGKDATQGMQMAHAFFENTDIALLQPLIDIDSTDMNTYRSSLLL